MEKLNYAVLKQSGYTGYILENAPEKVLQFGEGNFLRAFVNAQYNRCHDCCVFVVPLKLCPFSLFSLPARSALGFCYPFLTDVTPLLPFLHRKTGKRWGICVPLHLANVLSILLIPTCYAVPCTRTNCAISALSVSSFNL